MKKENEKIYQIAVDEGFARKVVFINRDAFPDRNLSKVMPLVEQAGNEEKFRGFHASAPTIYCYMDNFHQQKWDAFYRHQGSLYERHDSHQDIVVYCHIKKLDEYENGSAAGKFIKDLISAFPQNKN